MDQKTAAAFFGLTANHLSSWHTRVNFPNGVDARLEREAAEAAETHARKAAEDRAISSVGSPSPCRSGAMN